ncbi:Hypothetical predicted protein [Olea europaea subsp. europaea]|uniref:Uncharacterized protein n=1 Tax=Olea europaea subsp. europaea TaxID=158383 RepID=A0A8S0SHJ8_OLEEU|nr:Hypothetical predicted protein [Olea europaea subsp. europaea]
MTTTPTNLKPDLRKRRNCARGGTTPLRAIVAPPRIEALDMVKSSIFMTASKLRKNRNLDQKDDESLIDPMVKSGLQLASVACSS